MWINFTKKPMNPIIANPIAVAMAIFWNSGFRNTKLKKKKKHKSYITFCIVTANIGEKISTDINKLTGIHLLITSMQLLFFKKT